MTVFDNGLIRLLQLHYYYYYYYYYYIHLTAFFPGQPG